MLLLLGKAFDSFLKCLALVYVFCLSLLITCGHLVCISLFSKASYHLTVDTNILGMKIVNTW